MGRKMKEKLTKLVIVMLAAICMAGCSARDSEGQSLGMVNTESVETNDNLEELSQTGDLMMEGGQTKKGKAELNSELFDGLSVRVWHGKGNTLLVLKADTLYFYDVASAQIKAKVETELSESATFYPCKDGYFAADRIMKGGAAEELDDDPMMVEVDDDDMECLGIFYNDSLKETQKISLGDIEENAAWGLWAVSFDGAMLGYYDQWSGLNLYDLNSQKKQKLLNPEEMMELNLLNIDALFFEEETYDLIFTGQTNLNGSTAASWGRIGMDGTGFENHILERDFGLAVGYHDGKLLIGEDSIFFKGGMAYVDTETGETMYYTDINRALPVSGPYFSADGTVVATTALDTNQMEISIYRTADFSLLYKEVISDDMEEMFYRSPQICLFPDFKTCIVCMGGHNDIPQKAVLLNY